LEIHTVQSQGLFQALDVLELCIRKSLRSALLAILNDSDVENLAALKELGNSLLGRIVREVAQMRCEGGLGGKCLGEVVTNRVVASVRIAAAAATVGGRSRATIGGGEGLVAISVLNLVGP